MVVARLDPPEPKNQTDNPSITRNPTPAFPEDDDQDKKKGKGGKGKEGEAPEMSAEDKALMEGLELAVARAQERDAGVQQMALEHLRKEIRAATSSMTSVPKPLKFLRPHYATLKTVRSRVCLVYLECVG